MCCKELHKVLEVKCIAADIEINANLVLLPLPCTCQAAASLAAEQLRDLLSSSDGGGAQEEEVEAFTLHLKVSFQERLLSVLPGACSAAAQKAGAEVEAAAQRAGAEVAAVRAELEAARTEAEAGKVCG